MHYIMKFDYKNLNLLNVLPTNISEIKSKKKSVSVSSFILLLNRFFNNLKMNLSLLSKKRKRKSCFTLQCALAHVLCCKTTLAPPTAHEYSWVHWLVQWLATLLVSLSHAWQEFIISFQNGWKDYKHFHFTTFIWRT